MIGRAVADAWAALGRPESFVVREHGAGDGALALGMLPTLPPVIAYDPVEVDPRRAARLRSRLADAGLGDRLAAGRRHGPIDGVIVANEVLDALPVHRVRLRGQRLGEIAVDVATDGRFIEVEVEPTTPDLAARLAAEGVTLAEGQTAEICLALDHWLAATAAPLRRGLVLLVDYGYPAGELYDPVRRPDGTLRAYVRHQVSDDPYRLVGRQDLTAHVDVTAVESVAHRAGLTTVGITTQAEALIGLGIEARLREIQADPATTFEAYTLLRSALMRLLDPAAMGRFRVMAFGREWPADAPPLRLFGFSLRSGPGRPGRRDYGERRIARPSRVRSG